MTKSALAPTSSSIRVSIMRAAEKSERVLRPRAISSALTNSKRFSSPERYSRANVVLPAPFGPAMRTRSGNRRQPSQHPITLLHLLRLHIHLLAHLPELGAHLRHAIL